MDRATLTISYFLCIVEEMARKQSIGDVELLILLALIRLGPEAYGVPIAREIGARGKRTLALGSVYAALERLSEKGLVTSQLGEATQERGGRASVTLADYSSGLREVQIFTCESLIGMRVIFPSFARGST